MTCMVRGLLFATALTATGAATAPEASARQAAATVAALDSIARAHVAHDRVAGASVAVVHRGDTLLMRGYGYVDLEWDVPTPSDGDAVYEIGSVTKQFTAAAVLQLAEAGRLDLDADVTRYLPDYDTQGRRIPLRRLLDHTSGIKGYTEMPVFGEFATRDLPRDSLVRVFEAVPLEFEPGTALIYNNSAYFLLGLVVEAVTDATYEEYVEERLFGALGMERSYYCDEGAVVERRAHGYDATPDGLRLKGYLDHQWPYAAGSLCSTVGDLVRWNQALHGGRVVGPASYQDMITPDPLVDGTPVRYAMGLGIGERNGRPVIAHGGGINGFLSDVQYFPDDDLLVVVLQNTAGPVGPGALADALVEAILGPEEPPAAVAYDGDLSLFAGRYRGPARGRTLTVEVTVADGALHVKPEGSDGDAQPLQHREGLTWAAGNTLFRFERGEAGVVALRMDQGGGHYVLHKVGGSG